jgi:hypothetical protein
MRSVKLVVLLIGLLAAAPLDAQEPRWTVDVTPASYVEAWDLNEEREWLTGLQVGIDRAVWRAVAVRAEGLLLHVRQATDDAWLRGATIGMRARRRRDRAQIFLDLAGGRAHAGQPVPPRGTQASYILLLGGGLEIPWSRVHLTASARWFHLSNNGSEGRHQNPDIQALGAFAGIGWRF